MTYAIAEVVYGIDLTHFPFKELQVEGCEDFDPDGFGVSHSYSGNGFTPIWIGPVLWNFNECGNFPLSELNKKAEVTPKVIEKWKKALKDCDQELLEALKTWIANHPDGGFTLEPQVLILWGSS